MNYSPEVTRNPLSRVIRCPECEGKGFVVLEYFAKPSMWGKPTITCDTCEGKGYTKESPALPAEAV